MGMEIVIESDTGSGLALGKIHDRGVFGTIQTDLNDVENVITLGSQNGRRTWREPLIEQKPLHAT
jgi:hypothetical protein